MRLPRWVTPDFVLGFVAGWTIATLILVFG